MLIGKILREIFNLIENDIKGGFPAFEDRLGRPVHNSYPAFPWKENMPTWGHIKSGLTNRQTAFLRIPIKDAQMPSFFVVEITRFELVTSALRTQRSTN